MAHSNHSQLVHMTNVLITHYRYAMLTNDRNVKKKIVEAKRTLYRHKKLYYTLERF